MAVLQELTTKLGFSVDESGLEKLRHKIDGIAEGVKVLAGIQIVEAIAHLAEKFAGFGEHLESAAVQAGLTAEELQKLQYAATQNAISADELSGGMARLGRVLFQAQKGSKGAAEVFARLGIDQEQLQSFDNVKDALLAVQDGIGNLATQQEKLAVIQQLFGRGGAKFLKFMQIGSKATEEFGKEAERVGAVVSTRDIENLANFEDRMTSLGQVIKSFFATVAGTLAPGLTKAIRSLQEAWAHNRGVITAGLERLAFLFGYYIAIALVVIQEFSKTLHLIIYGNRGIVGAVKSAANAIFETVVNLYDGLMALFQQANADGSITAAFKSFSEAMQSLVSLASALVSSLGQAANALAGLIGTDTSKLSAIAEVFRGIAYAVQLSLDGLKNISDWLTFGLKGGFGDVIGKNLFGDMRAPNAVAGAPSIGQAASGMVSLASGFGVPMPTSAAPLMASPSTPVAGGNSISVSSPITVNAAPGMDEKALADMVAKQQASALTKALNEAERDHTYGHLY